MPGHELERLKPVILCRLTLHTGHLHSLPPPTQMSCHFPVTSLSGQRLALHYSLPLGFSAGHSGGKYVALSLPTVGMVAEITVKVTERMKNKLRRMIWSSIVAQCVKDLMSLWRCGFNPWPHLVCQGSGIATSSSECHRGSSDVALLWLYHRLAAAALI